jgi:hypothetical protein
MTENTALSKMMANAIIGKRFRDQHGRNYTVHHVHMRDNEVMVRYDGQLDKRLLSFYKCLGDRPIEASSNSK